MAIFRQEPDAECRWGIDTNRDSGYQLAFYCMLNTHYCIVSYSSIAHSFVYFVHFIVLGYELTLGASLEGHRDLVTCAG